MSRPDVAAKARRDVARRVVRRSLSATTRRRVGRANGRFLVFARAASSDDTPERARRVPRDMPLGRLALFAAGGVGFVVGLALDGGGPGGDGDRPASRDADAERFVPPAVADGRAAREPEPTASAPASPAIERVSNDAVDARAEATTDARAEEPAVADAEAPPAPEAEHPAEAEEPVEVPVSRVEDQVSPVVVRLVDGAIRALVDAERASADAERERVVAHLVTAATAAVVAEAAADANAANAEPRSAVDPTPARARSVPSVHQTKSAMSVSRPAHSTRVAPRAVTFADDARSPPPRVPSIDVPSTPSRRAPRRCASRRSSSPAARNDSFAARAAADSFADATKRPHRRAVDLLSRTRAPTRTRRRSGNRGRTAYARSEIRRRRPATGVQNTRSRPSRHAGLGGVGRFGASRRRRRDGDGGCLARGRRGEAPRVARRLVEARVRRRVEGGRRAIQLRDGRGRREGRRRGGGGRR